MTKEQIQAIRERAERATDGPWDVEHLGPGHFNRDNGHFHVTRPDKSVVAECDAGGARLNADFIARARSDVPALCDTLEAAWGRAEKAERALRRLTNESRAFLADHPDPCTTNTRCFETAVAEARAALGDKKETP